jgi:hypothetical protein
MRFDKLYNKLFEQNFSPAITKMLGKPMCLKKICDKCGFMMPKYKGRYPKACPNCGDKVDDKDKEVQVQLTPLRNRHAGDTGLMGMPVGKSEDL